MNMKISTKMQNSLFIVFEGCEGSGKTTLCKYFKELLESSGREVVSLREPGSTKISDSIREIVLQTENMDSMVGLLLFTAARRQLITEKILPALKQGKIVICDRYKHSSYAYQGQDHGVRKVEDFNSDYGCSLEPDVVIYLDINPEIGMKRKKNNNCEFNHFDLKEHDFHVKAREIYNSFRVFNNFIRVDAEQPIEDVIKDITQIINAYL